MKLTSLSLDHFSAHLNTVIEFTKPVTLVVGALNSGKSSILQGLEIAFTGQCDRYRKKTDDYVALIHDLDRTRYVVEAKTDVGIIKRGCSADRKHFASFNDDAINADNALCAALHTTPAMVTACLTTTDFFELPEKDQKAMILKILGAEISWDEISKRFVDGGGEPEALTLIRDRDINSVTAIERTYKQCFDDRTVVNREKKELQPAEPPAGARPPIDAIQLKISNYEAERGALIRSLGAAEERIRQGSAPRRLQLNESINELVEWLEATKKPTEDGLKALHTKLGVINQDATAQRTQLSLLQDKLATARAARMVHEKNVTILSKFNGKCVVGQHDCPAPREVMTAAKTQEGDLLVTAASAVIELEAAIKDIEKQLNDKSGASKVEREIETYKRAGADYKVRAEQLGRYTKQLEELPEAASIEDQAAMEDAKSKIAVIDGSIAKGRAALDQAQVWTRREEELKLVASRRKAIETKSRHLESLVEFFGPKGVKVSLIEHKIAAFEALVNSGLKQFGFDFKFRSEPWEILVKGRPIDRLSFSERYRMGAALQVGIAKAIGFNFVAIDKAEILPPAERGQLVKMLLEAGVQAIVVATNMKPEADFLAKPPVNGHMDCLFVRNVEGVSKVAKL